MQAISMIVKSSRTIIWSSTGHHPGLCMAWLQSLSNCDQLGPACLQCCLGLAYPGLAATPLISLSTNSEPRHIVTGLKHQLIFQTQNVQVFVQKENWRVQHHKCYQLQRLNIKWKRKGIHWLYNLACITAASQLVLIHQQQSFK